MSEKVLRLSVYDGSTMILERTLPLHHGMKLTYASARGVNLATTGEQGETNWSMRLVGPDPRPKKGAPPPPPDSYGEIVDTKNGFVVRFADGLAGWVGESEANEIALPDHVKKGTATRLEKGWEIALKGESQGKLIASTASVVFKLVPAPAPEPPKGNPEAMRKVAALLGGIDLEERLSSLGNSLGPLREQMAARVAISIANLADQCHRLEPVVHPENTLPAQLLPFADRLGNASALEATPMFVQLVQETYKLLGYRAPIAVGPFLLLREELFPAKLAVCLWRSGDYISMQGRIERINPETDLAATLARVSRVRLARLNVLEIGGAGEGVADLVGSASLPFSGATPEMIAFALREVESLRPVPQDG